MPKTTLKSREAAAGKIRRPEGARARQSPRRSSPGNRLGPTRTDSEDPDRLGPARTDSEMRCRRAEGGTWAPRRAAFQKAGSESSASRHASAASCRIGWGGG